MTLLDHLSALLRRWPEPLAYGALLLALTLALWGVGWFAHPVGWAVLGGASLIAYRLGRAAILEQLARGREGRLGPGLVEIAERRIVYWGPESGGAVSLDALRAVSVARTEDGPFDEDVFWVLETADPEETLRIPSGAEGATGLPTAFEGLPGFDLARAAAATRAPDPGLERVWSRPPSA
ncbi:MAG: hypothetical protein AAFR16_03010 [Pseudomonadota bacterium]